QDQSAQTSHEPAAARDYLAEITVFESANGPLTKRIRLADGKLAIAPAAWMARGTARRVRLGSVQELADLINGFTSQEAYGLGRLKDGIPDHVLVVTDDKLDGTTGPSVIARTKEFLVFKEGEPGLALFDVDVKAMPEAVASRMAEYDGDVWGV